jgi:hypothetical protein
VLGDLRSTTRDQVPSARSAARGGITQDARGAPVGPCTGLIIPHGARSQSLAREPRLDAFDDAAQPCTYAARVRARGTTALA